MHARIALLSGDGIGPEVLEAARSVLDTVAVAFGHDVAYDSAVIGGAAIEQAGEPLPRRTVEICRSADAVLLGAVGGPRWDALPAATRPEAGLLGMRKALGLYANLRPVSLHPRLADASPLKNALLEGVDLVVVRELTGGVYFGEKKRHQSAAGAVASDLCIYSVAEIERITRVACELARSRRGRLTSVDKANVLETSRLWREVVVRVVRDEYPDLDLEHLLVDACAMHLITRPASFDVIVTENMFGDILSDETSVLAGSIGVLPSASLGDSVNRHGKRAGLYEPIHGSAPAIAGKGIANPIGAILSVAMMLRLSLGLEAEARAVERAVAGTVARGILTPDLAAAASGHAGSAEVARSITAAITTLAPSERVGA